MRSLSGRDIRQRLCDPALADRLDDLGFGAGDRSKTIEAAMLVAETDDSIQHIATLADRLLARLGDFGVATAAPTPTQSIWSGSAESARALGDGVLPMLTLVVTATEVAEFHARRGIDPTVTTATLADLGRQVAVHRATYQAFGLHTQDWLTLVWSGTLYSLGRLQFNVQPEATTAREPGWVLSTHIPSTGPLSPTAVDHSFATAIDFFARYFPDYPTRDFYCQSWLLDPAVTRALPDSNLAAFQRRWDLFGDPTPGDEDVRFFVFNKRGPADLDALPTDTTLQRAVVRQLQAGEHWTIRTGRLGQHASVVQP